MPTTDSAEARLARRCGGIIMECDSDYFGFVGISKGIWQRFCRLK